MHFTINATYGKVVMYLNIMPVREWRCNDPGILDVSSKRGVRLTLRLLESPLPCERWTVLYVVGVTNISGIISKCVCKYAVVK